MTKTIVKTACGICGVTGVKIFRPTHEFYRPENNRCSKCLGEYDIAGKRRSYILSKGKYYIPCIRDEDGGADDTSYGFGNVPSDLSEKWNKLPENI